MCGRARSTTSPHALAQAFCIAPSRVYGAGQHQPRYNFHPGQSGPVLVREDGRPHSYHTHTSSSSGSSTATASSSTSPRPAFPPSAAAKAQAAADARDKATHRHEGEEEEEGMPLPKAGETAVVVMKWGLVPSWSKDTKPDHFRAFNARSEGVAAKPFFKRLVNSRRCVVVLDGCVHNLGAYFVDRPLVIDPSNPNIPDRRFYEWVDQSGQKQPYFVHYEDGRPMTFAGLYDCWVDGSGEPTYTYTILTRTYPIPCLSLLPPPHSPTPDSTHPPHTTQATPPPAGPGCTTASRSCSPRRRPRRAGSTRRSARRRRSCQPCAPLWTSRAWSVAGGY